MPRYGWRVKNPELFVEQLVRGLHDAGEEMFDLSQRDVPVDTGTLKKSGILEKLANGFRILYRTSYAARQEFGIPAGFTELIKKHSVRAHARKPKGGKTIQQVKAHDRGPFTRTFEKGMEGRFYLTNSFETVRPRLVQFIQRLVRKH